MSIDPGIGDRHPRASLSETAWKAWLGLGLAMLVGSLFFPSREVQGLFFPVSGVLASLTVLAGIAIHHPPDRRPWLTLAVGLALIAAGDWIFRIIDAFFAPAPFPSVADIVYLPGMGLLAVGLLWLLRGRVPGGDRGGMLDAVIVAVGIGLVTWVFLMAPIVAGVDQSFRQVAVALAYPMLDILLLGVLIRLFLAPGRRAASLWFLIGAVVFFLLADYAYSLLAVAGTYQVGQLVDAGWLLGGVFWGAAALHPSMCHVAEPVGRDEARDARLSAPRVVMLAGASLMAPVLLVIQWMVGAHLEIPVMAGGCVVLFLLVIARLTGVVGDLRRTLLQRRGLQAELERRAERDPLTGLPNRVLFRDRLEHALARRQHPAAVLFIDLDDFKTVNDTAGHGAGDAVLRAVGDVLSRTVRPADTVSRLGGDEFAVLLDDSLDVYEAGLVAGRLISALQTPISVGADQFSVGVSIGISLGTGVSHTADELMREADIAMYVAKGSGKGRFTMFDAATHEAVVRGMELRGDLEAAIRDQQFELHYQPIIDLGTRAVAGVEALVRWRHPTRGLLLPAEFIPLAEMTGAIVPLGRWILEEACREAATWAAEGESAADRCMTVNLSAVQLVQPGLGDVVAEVLASSGLAPWQLILELTESARLDQVAAAANLRQLREIGVRLAIDDFGTGYASLQQLKRIPFDIVKIDYSFVAKLAPGSRAESLICGIVDMARRLGISTVAEGIETEAQYARLQGIGCTYGQGFLFAHPMPAAKLHRYLKPAGPGQLTALPRAKPIAKRRTRVAVPN